VNQTSLEKIQAASTFLRYFRRSVPANTQALIRPYLDQPYQLALNILDCCEDPNCCTPEAIAQRLAISKSSVRQVLSALREGGLVFMAGTSKGWFPLEAQGFDATPVFPDMASFSASFESSQLH